MVNGEEQAAVERTHSSQVSAAPAGEQDSQGDYSPDPQGDYSPGPKSERSEHSPRTKGDYSPKAKSDYSPCKEPAGEVIDLAAFRAMVTSHPSAYYDKDKWKRSRVKKGYLIHRIEGYDPVESEYGVSYLKVIRRHPKVTSGDYSLYEHAGFFTWDALQASRRLVKERKREQRITGNSNQSS